VTSTALSIRFATTADAATIHGFICALAEYEREPDAVEVTVDELAAQLRETQPPFECLIAEREQVAVGFALFFHSYSTWRGRRGLYLEDLFVPPARRGAGVGHALLRRLAQIALERGCARMEWSVLNWNELAISFYRRLGAELLDDWRNCRIADGALRALADPAH